MNFFGIPRNGLVGEWLLDGNANDTNDGTKNNGTATNVTYVSSDVGYQKQRGNFNGASSYVVGPTGVPSLTTVGTFQVNFKTVGVGGLYMKFTKGDAGIGTNNGAFEIRTNGTVLEFILGGSVVTTSGSGFSLSPNTEYNVVAVWNYADTSRRLRLYVNGAYIDKALANDSCTTFGSNATALNIGRRSDGFYSDGLISCCRIWNRVITEAERLALWHEFNRKLGGGSDFGAYVPKPLIDLDFNGDQSDVAEQISNTSSNVTYGQSDYFGLNRCATFNGTSSVITTGGVTLPSAFTMACFIRRDNGNDQSYFTAPPYGSGGPHLFYSATNLVYRGSGTTNDLTYATSFGTGWHTVIVSQNGTSATMYVDGSQVATGTVNSGAGTWTFDLGRLTASLYWFSGAMLRFQAYGTNLDANQAKYLHNQLVSRYPYAFRRSIPQAITSKSKLWIPGIVSGTTAYDLSGNGNNGTTSGSPVAIREYQNNGLTFNGSSQSVTVPNLSGIFGVSMWVYATAVSKTLFTYSAGKTISLDGSYGITSANLTSPVYYVNNGVSQVGYGSKWMLVTVGHSTDSTSSGSWATSSLTGKASDLFFWNEVPTQEAIQKLYFATYRN